MIHISYKKSNFGGAFFFLPKAKKRALSVVYSYCRLADDIVDEHYPDAEERLLSLREETERVFAGKAVTELGKNLQEVISQFKIPKQYFFDLIDGVSTDLKPHARFQTAAELEKYLYGVAGAVGLMCIEIFGYKKESTKEYAVTLGRAVQMTNILRDIYEDGKENRMYLPREDLDTFGVREEDLFRPSNNDRVKALMFFEIERTQRYYEDAEDLLPKEDFKSLLPARAMGNIYFGILEKLAKTCEVRIKKIKLNKAQKALILIKTLGQSK